MSELKIRVVDIPVNVTAEQAERLLNEPFDANYYLDKTFPGLGGLGIRAVFRQRCEKTLTLSPEDETAKAIVHENWSQSASAVRFTLADAGIVRTADWITNVRVEIAAKTARARKSG